MKIKRFNESLDNNQMREWIEDLIVPLKDTGAFDHYKIIDNESAVFRIIFEGIEQKSFEMSESDYSYLEKFGEFYIELSSVMNNLKKHFDIIFHTYNDKVSIELFEKVDEIYLPPYMKLVDGLVEFDFDSFKNYTKSMINVTGYRPEGNSLYLYFRDRKIKNAVDSKEYLKKEFKKYNRTFNIHSNFVGRIIELSFIDKKYKFKDED